MKMEFKKIGLNTFRSLLVLGMALLARPHIVHATNEGWGFELSPYVWFTGIEGDVTVANRMADIDVGFDDLIDKVDGGVSFLLLTRYNRWVLWNQLDFFSLGSDGKTTALGTPSLDTDTLFYTAAFGYQFPTFKNGTIDVMAGIRYLSLENELTIPTLGKFKKTFDKTDIVIVLNPRFPFGERWAFYPIFSAGAGDSEATYEIQPLVEFKFTKHIAARAGYRRLYYNIEKDIGSTTKKAEFDGSFHGFIFGLGVSF